MARLIFEKGSIQSHSLSLCPVLFLSHFYFSYQLLLISCRDAGSKPDPKN